MRFLPTLFLFVLGVHLLAAPSAPVHAQSHDNAMVTAEPGEGIWSILRRSGVEPTSSAVAEFKELNEGKLHKGTDLRRDVTYRIPVRSLHEPLFGKDHATFAKKSDRLAGHVYYIVGGHGGPDPGSLGMYQGKQIPEDEIAYDTALRLSRELMAEGATVYVVVQDPNDGIREKEYLPVDRDEVYLGGKTIALNQLRRLRDRADIINDLFKKHRKTAKSQQVISLHVDAYGLRVEPQVDVHFIVGSDTGRTLANTIRTTVEAKYAHYQPTRGYQGKITSRNLMIIRATKPTAILIELGNIRHRGDQHRLVKPSNRQTLAEWIKEGLLQAAYGQSV